MKNLFLKKKLNKNLKRDRIHAQHIRSLLIKGDVDAVIAYLNKHYWKDVS